MAIVFPLTCRYITASFPNTDFTRNRCPPSACQAASTASNPPPRSPSMPGPRNSRPRARMSSGSARASPISTLRSTSRRRRSAPFATASRNIPRWTARPALKQAVIAKFKRDNGLDYTPEEILVSVGGKQSFFNLAQALLDNGDEVIIPAPYWVSYPDMVLLADGSPVIISAGIDQGFKITPEQLDRHHHSQDAPARHQQPIEPDRRGLYARRTGGARRSAAQASARADRHRRHVRTYPVVG